MHDLSISEPTKVSEIRPWRKVVPPPTRILGLLEAGALLDEIPGSLGVVLWLSARDVSLWVGTPASKRHGLFGGQRWTARMPHSVLDVIGGKPLGRALRGFALLTASPHSVGPPDVSIACMLVTDWARAEGHMFTERWFVELACAVCPYSSQSALRAGKVAYRSADYERGMQWFRRAIGIALQARDKPAIAAGYLTWAALEQQRGDEEASLLLCNLAMRYSGRAARGWSSFYRTPRRRTYQPPTQT